MSLQLTVKDFSKLAGVSPRNLRYYDDIGLLKASGISKNGYRYYTIDKVEEIHFINYFRHMGVSIKEIKKHMENRNIEEYETILQDQLKKVHVEMAELKLLEERIQKRITSIHKESSSIRGNHNTETEKKKDAQIRKGNEGTTGLGV